MAAAAAVESTAHVATAVGDFADFDSSNVPSQSLADKCICFILFQETLSSAATVSCCAACGSSSSAAATTDQNNSAMPSIAMYLQCD